MIMRCRLALPFLLALAPAPASSAETASAPVVPPTRKIAVATARHWLQALVDGDIAAAMDLTACPFVITSHGIINWSFDPAGRAREPRRVRRLLEDVKKTLVFDDLPSYLGAPNKEMSLRVFPTPEETRVRFTYDQNHLADGTYCDARIDVAVDAAGAPRVSRATFWCYSLN